MNDGKVKMERLDQAPPAQRNGKQVFMDGEHFADATTEEYADFMVTALNAHAERMEEQLSELFRRRANINTLGRIAGIECRKEDKPRAAKGIIQ